MRIEAIDACVPTVQLWPLIQTRRRGENDVLAEVRADRLSKYLARFELDWKRVLAAR